MNIWQIKPIILDSRSSTGQDKEIRRAGHIFSKIHDVCGSYHTASVADRV